MHTRTHSLPPYHFTEEPSSRRSNRSRAIICLPPTIRRSNLTAGRHLGGMGSGAQQGKTSAKVLHSVFRCLSPTMGNLCVLHTDPSPLGGNRCVRGYFGLPCAHCTSALHIVLVHTQGSFVSKILTPHASPVGFYRLCQGFSQQWICKERKGG